MASGEPSHLSESALAPFVIPIVHHNFDGLLPMESTEGTELFARFAVMAIIFCVSLFAVSFPAVSKRVSYLRIPPILFFVGKHFGTGVILSTAFVHLLQDAFESLQDPEVKRHTGVGHWTGLIVLGSLLMIFLVEYISTAYVDNLHSYASAPSTPKVEPAQLPPVYSSPVTPVSPTRQSTDETTPLLGPRPTVSSAQARRHTIAVPRGHEHSLIPGHHRHEPSSQHEEHHRDHPRCGLMRFYSGDTETGTNVKLAPTEEQTEERHPPRRQHSHGHSHHHSHGDLDALLESSDSDMETDSTADEVELAIGRKRQIVGILVLQLGIMLHSLVIGLTLALASGADFTSLVAAISFHQLFEGLSLGIRIAALPTHPDPEQCRLAWLRPVLALLFALTTPTGILTGLATFGGGGRAAGGVGLKVAEGVLSAVSAGMLIYAACVEMLAGDFVLDPTLWRASKGRQVLALLSVGTGATAMALLGIVH
ncbi:Zinc/iron permease [Gloeopeniophorella convolvens]|nr:Zinc/iron permease [Gloeopeniophorella convolvens]